MDKLNLHTPIEYLKSVGPQKADVLRKELAIYTYEDLIKHYPFRYVDRTRFYKINEAINDAPYIQIIVRIVSFEILGEKISKRIVAQALDDTGKIELIWFQGIKWVEKNLKINELYIIFGKVTTFNGKLQMSHPEIELYFKNQTIKGNIALQPVYSSTEKLKLFKLDSYGLQKAIRTLFESHQIIIENIIPEYIIQSFKLFNKTDAITQIHLPNNVNNLQKAIYSLKFEELFIIQTKLLKSKQIRTQKYKGHIFKVVGEKFSTFYNYHLPFELTNAQKKVIKEIRFDTQNGIQMNRLLQGDVGSGKTIVALMIMLLAIDNGYQACLMAPTEILAAQHFASISNLIKNNDVEVELLTGSTKRKNRTDILNKIVDGRLSIIIGTHALIEDSVVFKNLGLVIIDEQHRFGVEQRAKLWKKNAIPPHVLVMTATPIPRTLAMTLYGDLDISIINELPAGRKPIKTVHLFESQRLRMFGIIREEIAKGRQAYIVYPLIKESEQLDLKNLHEGFNIISVEFPLPKYRLSIVHGQMKPSEKDFEMQRFIKGETQIMVSTTVIEVGVNVPNASVMVIENAERFGLSQLHQLRGRVGRGAEYSFCILMSGNKLTKEAKIRLDTMVRTQDGFEISEIDLQLRGPGNIEGKEQSGVLDLKIADLAKDQSILYKARECVTEIFKSDPELTRPQHKNLKDYLLKQEKSGITFNKIS